MKNETAKRILKSIKSLDFDGVHKEISLIENDQERADWTRKLFAVFRFVNEEFIHDLIAGNPEIDDLRD